MKDIKSMERLKSYFTTEDKIILFVGAMILLPQEIAVVSMLMVLFYAWRHKSLRSSIEALPGYQILFGFLIFETILSMIYQNWVGAINALGMIVLMLYISWYRIHAKSETFIWLMDMILALSVLIGIYALFQFQQISASKGYSFFDFHIFNSPKRRITATFGNANLYATMLELFLVMCMVRFLQVKNYLRRFIYLLIALFQFFILYLTGCRTALLPLVVVVPVYLWVTDQKGLFALSLLCIAVVLIGVVVHPTLIPRLSDMKTLESRYKIWSCAWMGIKNHPLFGMGPQSYGMYCKMYNGHVAPHCHNIYIDSVASYGIVGTITILYYAFRCVFPNILKARKEDAVKYGIIISVLLIYLIHGTLDCTFNVLGTAGLALMLACCPSMKENS